MTQKELADAAGFKQVTIARWESGKHAPSAKAVKKLASVLGVHAEDIIDD